MYQSIATLDHPEFINLKQLDINPLMSSCDIKVLYLGENRNHSHISKDVAIEMAKTLRGAPIVGYYKQEKEDFRDHGEKVVFEDGEVKVECMTVPYGFVAPDAEVWFQKYEDIDDNGMSIIREYMMTTGYLWTGQFEEAKLAIEGQGRPQSMELDEKTLQGSWAKNNNSNMEFFIINDAIISKLCILGEDVEPCFEGASISAPNINASFSLDDRFKETLNKMKQELYFALEGGPNKMEDVKIVEETLVTEEEKILETVDNNAKSESNENEIVTEEETTLTEDNISTPEETTEFVKKEDEKEDEETEEKENNSDSESTDTESKETDSKEDKDKEDEEKAKKYSLLEEEYNKLKSEFSALEQECESLRAYKAIVEDGKKDDLIASFYMLDDEDKKDIITNKSKFTLDEIESKLSVIYARKSINKDKEVETSENESVTTYTIAEEIQSVPDWIRAVRATEKEMKY